MADYTYYFADTLSGEIVDELALGGATYGYAINEAAPWHGEIPLYGLKPARQRAVLDATVPWRRSVWIERDSGLVYGGPVRKRTYDSGTRKLVLDGSDWLGMFERRHMVPAWNIREYAGVDQFTIALDIIEHCLTDPRQGAQFPLVLPNPWPTSGVLRDRHYDPGEIKEVLQAVQEFAAVLHGFDFRIDVRWSTQGAPQAVLVLGYPFLGVQGANAHLFEYPGNITTYSWPEDGDQMATDYFGRSQAGAEGAVLTYDTFNPKLAAIGYPLLEVVTDYQDIVELATLQGHVEAAAASASGPAVVPSLTSTGSAILPAPGAFHAGDHARVRVSDDRFPANDDGTPGLNAYLRILGATVTPGGEGKEESVTYNVGPVTMTPTGDAVDSTLLDTWAGRTLDPTGGSVQ